MLILTTERLVLRDFSLHDLDAYIALRNSEKFKRFYSEEDVTKEKSKALLELFIEQSKDQPRMHFQLAITTLNDVLIGSCGFRIEEDKQASIGCELAQEWQSQGFAEEAAKGMINYALSSHDLHRFYAETISENIPAIKLCKSIGMRVEKELVEHRCFKGRWWNTTILSVLADELEVNR